MTKLEELADRLGKVHSFKKVPFTERLAILLAGEIRIFPPDYVIFSEQEPSAGMYVLLQGHVHLCKIGLKGQQDIIVDIDPVIMFNEISLFDGESNPYTAITTERCLVWHISYAAYQRLLGRYAQHQGMDVALGMLEVMAKRYRQLLDSYTDLSFLTVPNRVAKFIYELSDQGQKPIDRRDCSIKEMAARIASVPEAISRSLNILERQGIITKTRTTITVLEPHLLARLAQSEDVQALSELRAESFELLNFPY